MGFEKTNYAEKNIQMQNPNKNKTTATFGIC